MLSVQIANATPSQIEAHRRRQAFRNSIGIQRGISVNNSDNARATMTIAPLAPYVSDEPKQEETPPPIKLRYFPGNARSIVRIICRGCAHYFYVEAAEIESRIRTCRVATARQVGFVVAREITGWSLPEIGRRFGGRDHTTVMHGLRKIERLRAKDAEFDDRIKRLVSDVIDAIRADNPDFAVPGECQRDVLEQPGQGAGENTVS